jgi:hypothetical protein
LQEFEDRCYGCAQQTLRKEKKQSYDRSANYGGKELGISNFVRGLNTLRNPQ